MTRTTVALLALLCLMIACSTSLYGQSTPDGRWSGAIQITNVELEINVHFDAATTSATIDIPAQGAFGLPLRNVRVSADSVYLELPAGPGLAVFESSSVSETTIVGAFRQGGAAGSFHLEPNPRHATAPVVHADETPVSVAVPSVTPGDAGVEYALHGALAVPPGGSTTLVILHAGSGPTNRNGNTQGMASGSDNLLLLSDALVRENMAVLRYDKRGVGESVDAYPNEADLRFDTYVDDLVAWVDQARVEGRFETIVLAGHSEGALIATLAAARTRVDGLVLLSGAGRAAPVVLREQLSRNLPPELYKQSDGIIAGLERGETSPSPPPQLAALFRESVQPYLISWFRHDPAKTLGSLATPTIVIQGTTDLQISVADADALAATRDDVKLVLVEGMNHVLKDAEGDLAKQAPTYGDPSLPLSDGLVSPIVSFIADL